MTISAGDRSFNLSFFESPRPITPFLRTGEGAAATPAALPAGISSHALYTRLRFSGLDDNLPECEFSSW